MLCDPTWFIFCAFIEVLLPRSSLMSMRLPKRSLRSVRCKKLAKLFKPKHSAPLQAGHSRLPLVETHDWISHQRNRKCCEIESEYGNNRKGRTIRQRARPEETGDECGLA